SSQEGVGVRTRADLIERDGLETRLPCGLIVLQPETVRRRADLLRIRRHEVVPPVKPLGLAVPADVEPFADADVARNDVALGWRALERRADNRRTAGRPVIGVERLQRGITLAVKRRGHGGELLAHVA